MAALQATELSYRYRGSSSPAVDGVEFSVEAGQFAALLGPNGAGKTTLVHLITGLFAADSGSLKIFGKPIANSEARRAIGFCPQELALYSTLSATENLKFFGRLASLDTRALKERTATVLDAVRLTEHASVRVERFSGGMKRRLNLAIAMLAEPKLLVLDEPTVGVDAQSRLAIFDALEAQNESGTTILYTTHYMEEVERMCREVVVIDHGRVLTQAPTSELAALGTRESLVLEIDGEPDRVLAELLAAGHEAKRIGDSKLELTGVDLASELASLQPLAQRGVLQSVSTRRPTLEERFLKLTGEELRDS